MFSVSKHYITTAVLAAEIYNAVVLLLTLKKRIFIPMIVRVTAPIIISIVCTKSVQTTAVRPPVMVNRAATANSANILAYVSSFSDCSINIAPAYRSDYNNNINNMYSVAAIKVHMG